MLNRVAVSEDLWSLYTTLQSHLYTGIMTQEGMIELASFLDELPENILYQGPIYRGLGVHGQDVPNLFRNQEFKTDDYSGHTLVESWTSEPDVAMKFANNWRENGVGIVVKSDTEHREVVFDFTTPVRDYLKAKYKKVEDNFVDIFSEFENESEITVRHIGEVTYRLCDDVVYLLAVMSKLEDNFPESFKIFWNILEEESKERLFNQGYDRLVVFQCLNGEMWSIYREF